MAIPQARRSTGFDWNDPPFAGGRAGARMGLSPVAVEDWLTPADRAATERKRARLLSDPQQVSAVWEARGAAVALERASLQLEAAMAILNLDHPPAPDATAALPLVPAALAVREDLCLLWRVGSDYRLLAGVVCAPSYWSLPVKMGLSLPAIHAPVAAMDKTLQARMQRFFVTLPASRVFMRRNWFVHGSAEYFQPDPDALDYGHPTPLYIRSERQTLRRLDDDLVLFAIRVDIEPLARVAAYPQALVDLRQAVAGLAAGALADFGGASKQRCVLNALQQLGAIRPRENR